MNLPRACLHRMLKYCSHTPAPRLKAYERQMAKRRGYLERLLGIKHFSTRGRAEHAGCYAEKWILALPQCRCVPSRRRLDQPDHVHRSPFQEISSTGQSTEMRCSLLVKPISNDATAGLNASDLNALTSPAFLTRRFSLVDMVEKDVYPRPYPWKTDDVVHRTSP